MAVLFRAPSARMSRAAPVGFPGGYRRRPGAAHDLRRKLHGTGLGRARSVSPSGRADADLVAMELMAAVPWRAAAGRRPAYCVGFGVSEAGAAGLSIAA